METWLLNVRKRPFDFYWGGGQEDYFGPGFFLFHTPEHDFYLLHGTILDFFSQDRVYTNNKQNKKFII